MVFLQLHKRGIFPIRGYDFCPVLPVRLFYVAYHAIIRMDKYRTDAVAFFLLKRREKLLHRNFLFLHVLHAHRYHGGVSDIYPVSLLNARDNLEVPLILAPGCKHPVLYIPVAFLYVLVKRQQHASHGIANLASFVKVPYFKQAFVYVFFVIKSILKKSHCHIVPQSFISLFADTYRICHFPLV